MLPVLFALTWLHRCTSVKAKEWTKIATGLDHDGRSGLGVCFTWQQQPAKAARRKMSWWHPPKLQGKRMGLLWIMAEYLSYVHPFNIIFLDVTSRSLIKAGHSSSKCWCEKLRCLILLHSSLCWSYYLTLDRYAVDSTPHSMQKPSGVPHKPSKKRCKNDENLGPLEDPQRKVQKYITTLGIWQRGPPPQSLSQYLLKPKCELSS